MWDDTQAEGMTDPNPMVGAVVVKDGIVRPSPAILLDTARHSSTQLDRLFRRRGRVPTRRMPELAAIRYRS